jgi:hypothetical protein
MPKPSTNPTKVAQALVDLQQRVARGQEFPDAQWAAASRHNVDPDALADAYDEADRAREQRSTDTTLQQGIDAAQRAADTYDMPQTVYKDADSGGWWHTHAFANRLAHAQVHATMLNARYFS